MTERPIICTAQEVRGILDGRQTQLRRVIKPQPTPFGKTGWVGGVRTFNWAHKSWDKQHTEEGMLSLCPYGKPGGRLLCKETFALENAPGIGSVGPIAYRADCDRENNRCPFVRAEYGRWNSGVVMPRWASRLTLEVVSERVERLLKITESDCRAEGTGDWPWPACRGIFLGWWEQRHGKGSWQTSPWVWVVEFRQVTP